MLVKRFSKGNTLKTSQKKRKTLKGIFDLKDEPLTYGSELLTSLHDFRVRTKTTTEYVQNADRFLYFVYQEGIPSTHVYISTEDLHSSSSSTITINGFTGKYKQYFIPAATSDGTFDGYTICNAKDDLTPIGSLMPIYYFVSSIIKPGTTPERFYTIQEFSWDDILKVYNDLKRRIINHLTDEEKTKIIKCIRCCMLSWIPKAYITFKKSIEKVTSTIVIFMLHDDFSKWFTEDLDWCTNITQYSWIDQIVTNDLDSVKKTLEFTENNGFENYVDIYFYLEF